MPRWVTPSKWPICPCGKPTRALHGKGLCAVCQRKTNPQAVEAHRQSDRRYYAANRDRRIAENRRWRKENATYYKLCESLRRLKKSLAKEKTG